MYFGSTSTKVISRSWVIFACTSTRPVEKHKRRPTPSELKRTKGVVQADKKESGQSLDLHLLARQLELRHLHSSDSVEIQYRKCRMSMARRLLLSHRSLLINVRSSSFLDEGIYLLEPNSHCHTIRTRQDMKGVRPTWSRRQASIQPHCYGQAEEQKLQCCEKS